MINAKRENVEILRFVILSEIWNKNTAPDVLAWKLSGAPHDDGNRWFEQDGWVILDVWITRYDRMRECLHHQAASVTPTLAILYAFSPQRPILHSQTTNSTRERQGNCRDRF